MSLSLHEIVIDNINKRAYNPDKMVEISKNILQRAAEISEQKKDLDKKVLAGQQQLEQQENVERLYHEPMILSRV